MAGLSGEYLDLMVHIETSDWHGKRFSTPLVVLNMIATSCQSFPHSDSTPRVIQAGATLILATVLWNSIVRGEDPRHAAEELFEKQIRPLILNKCVDCHGPDDPNGGLSLTSREAMLRGGEHGSALVLEKPDESLLLQAVRQTGDLKMPPDDKLSAQEIDLLAAWVRSGAAWPESVGPLVSPKDSAAEEHWAFQPVRDPEIPKVESSPKNPIDAFIQAKLASHGLQPSPEADRRTLIRRVFYTLTGLPPSPEEVEAFVNDADPHAYEKLVDRLLESPQYGEQWARHWLDIARYSDTKGYVYAREERFWVHAWAYRDWIVKAFNRDLPYDQFLRLQIAADQVESATIDDLAAMGFLTLGRRFLGVPADIIDDRIDVVCRGTMALTVSCARCHDHKYDPIPTADYYSLYGVFNSSAERVVRLPSAPGDEAFEAELKKRQDTLAAKIAEKRKSSSDRARGRIRDYLQTQTELDKYPAQGFDQVFELEDLLPAFVRRWELFLRETKRNRHPVFVAWHAYQNLDAETFATEAVEVTASLQQMSENELHPLVKAEFATVPQSFEDVIDRYAALFQRAIEAWDQAQAPPRDEGEQPPERLADDSLEQIRQLLYGPESPTVVPDLPVVHIETFFASSTTTELWKLQGEVDRWMINASHPVPCAMTLVDKPEPVSAYIFKRGNAVKHGARVDRHFLSLFSDGNPEPFANGSGRRELAEAIVEPSNPLTARVAVNRAWAHHFGEGLVDTPSDFGLRSHSPSHPELLDWLTTRFIEDGWSLK
ncbi:MAG: DUF1549 domain-containing protein, partial [Planctomycetaceae bacterium]|nr:DUF1549 domain-containing protein [Planctomycetaceae bacterium]